MATVSALGMVPGEFSISVGVPPAVVTSCTWIPGGIEGRSDTFAGHLPGPTSWAAPYLDLLGL